jgi:hypothetical protein
LANTAKYETSWWSVELPYGWSVEEHPICTTFKCLDLQGVFQISAYRKESEVGKDEIAALADEDTEPWPVKIGTLAGVCTTHNRDGVCLRRWWLLRGRTLIFATYKGPIAKADAEIGAAENLLKTVQVRGDLISGPTL